MSIIRWWLMPVLAGIAVLVFAVDKAGSGRDPRNTSGVVLVAQFAHQVTGVAISEQGRMFVNFPRWTEDSPISVAEVRRDGTITPYPDAAWNAWRNARKDELAPGEHWVCVQSVVADGRGSLWVLDPAAPAQGFIVPGGPKLVRIDLATDRVARTYGFAQDVAPQGSYLNDVRFSPDGKFAFITDSGQRGAIVVVDLVTGKARRVLDGDPSTQPKKGLVVTADGRALRRPDGRKVEFAADGVALSKDGRYLYWQALTGDTLYRIRTDVLESRGLAGEDLSADVEPYGLNGVADGLLILRGSDVMFITSPQDNSIKLRDLSRGPSAPLTLVLQDEHLRWPDTLAQGPEGVIYVTTSRIQDSAFFKRDAPLALTTQLWRVRRSHRGVEHIAAPGP
jgi:sugar lactone lactonase YvrE